MSRIYTDEHLNLIADTKLSAREIGEILNVHPVTIYRFRKNNNIKVLPGAKLGKPNIKKMRQELRNCIGKNCLNTFTVQQSSKKKYCCHSCQQRTANVAAKGIGSRKIRNPNTTEYKRYARLVHGLSQKNYVKNIDIINPNNYNRKLCGVKDGWQLDHIKPIKECFEKGLSPEEAAAVENLRMLPWKENLMRNYVNQD